MLNIELKNLSQNQDDMQITNELSQEELCNIRGGNKLVDFLTGYFGGKALDYIGEKAGETIFAPPGLLDEVGQLPDTVGIDLIDTGIDVVPGGTLGSIA